MVKKKIKAIERPEEYRDSFEIEARRDYEKSKKSKKFGEWLPFEVYELIQTGYPVSNRGEMQLLEYGGTDLKGHLLPPKGEWCRVEDVKKIFDQLEIDLDIEFEMSQFILAD